jgi:GxxExxY protein
MISMMKASKNIVHQIIIPFTVQDTKFTMANPVNQKYLYSDLTAKIIGCAMEVHRMLGNGFQEVIYQRALEIEMRAQGLNFTREHEMKIYYKGEDIGTRRVDFFVEDKVMVEIKALIDLEDVHLAQAINYLEAYGLEVGLLINFGARSLQYKRVMKLSKKDKSSG